MLRIVAYALFFLISFGIAADHRRQARRQGLVSQPTGTKD